MVSGMRVAIISLLPEMFAALDHGVIGRAKQQGLLDIELINPREFVFNTHKTIDDKPYGGGPGMVMLAEPLLEAVAKAKARLSMDAKVVALMPGGRVFNHALAVESSQTQRLIMICGRYEGIDQRVIDSVVDECWSLGDFILSGGEFAAMAMVDAMARLLPGVLGNDDSSQHESFVCGRLEHPQYTRPESVAGYTVPEVLLSGNHAKIKRWQQQQSLVRTLRDRPDLITSNPLTEEEHALLKEAKQG